MKRDGWTGGVLVFVLAVAMIGILLPDPAHAQKNVTSAFDVRLGGYVQMNVIWDSDEPDDSPNNFRRFSSPKGDPGEGRETLRWTAFRTRLFMDVRGPDLWGAKSRAYIEFDYDGAREDATNANTPRMRHAYMRFDWPAWYLLIGQSTMLLTSAVGNNAELSGVTSGSRGDITAGSANRVPQIQVGTSIPMAGVKLDLKGSVQQSNTNRQSTDDNVDSGARSGQPAFGGLAALTVKLFGRDAVFGVSGHWAEETLTSGAAEADVNNTGVALEWILPLGPATGIGAFDFRGNWGTYENMTRWNLGNNAGVTSTNPASNPTEIASDGWWGELNWDINKNFAVGAGIGHMEDDTGDLRKAGGTQIEENEGWWLFAQWRDGPFLLEVLYGHNDTTRITFPAGSRSETDNQFISFLFRYRF